MVEKCLQVIKEKIEEIAKEHGYTGNHEIKITPTNSGGANYSSTLYFATIIDPRKQHMNLFVKLTNLNKEMVEDIAEGLNIFKLEYDLYTLMNNTYRDLEKKFKVPQNKIINIPKIYKGYFEPNEEFLIFEDLTKKGYEDYDRMKSVTWEYAARAVEQLANLHGLSITYKVLEPESFENAVKQVPNMKKKGEIFNKFAEKFAEASSIPVADNKKERLDKVIQSGKLFGRDLYDIPIKIPVLIHGDFRTSNLMHRRKNGLLEIAMLDFQIMALGSPVLDLIYFIVLCTDGNFRKLHNKELLDYYYKSLKAALERFGLDLEDVYPKKDFKNEYERYQIFGLMTAISTLSVVLVDPKHAPDMAAEGMESMVNMKHSDTYRRRLDELLEDYIACGLL